jgi:hypothetical protein
METGNGGGWCIDWKQRAGSLIPQQFDGRCLLEDQHKSVGEKHGSECWQVCRVLQWWLVGRSLCFLALLLLSFLLFSFSLLGPTNWHFDSLSPFLFTLHRFLFSPSLFHFGCLLSLCAAVVYGKALRYSVSGRFGGWEPGGAQDGQGYKQRRSDYMVGLYGAFASYTPCSGKQNRGRRKHNHIGC